jgi:hypothetical protein
LERQAGALTLHLEGIPEPTCTPLFVQFIDQDATIFNRDDVMVPGRTPVVPAPVTGMPFVGHALALGRVLFGEALDRHGLGADPTEGLVARTDRDGRGHLVPVKYASCFPGFAMYGKLMEVPRERVGISTGLSGLHKIPFTNYGNEAVVDLKLRVWGSEKARPTPDRLLWESEDAVPVGMDTKTCTMQRILEAGSASGDSVCSPWKH